MKRLKSEDVRILTKKVPLGEGSNSSDSYKKVESEYLLTIMIRKAYGTYSISKENEKRIFKNIIKS